MYDNIILNLINDYRPFFVALVAFLSSTNRNCLIVLAAYGYYVEKEELLLLGMIGGW